jgi:predicted GIY-YIG superfamily endonuclease
MKIVYILQSVNYPKRHYSGITSDFNKRLDEHNNGKCPHTSKYKPWQALVIISFTEDSKAQEFERYLKSGSGRAFAHKHF